MDFSWQKNQASSASTLPSLDLPLPPLQLDDVRDDLKPSAAMAIALKQFQNSQAVERIKDSILRGDIAAAIAIIDENDEDIIFVCPANRKSSILEFIIAHSNLVLFTHIWQKSSDHKKITEHRFGDDKRNGIVLSKSMSIEFFKGMVMLMSPEELLSLLFFDPLNDGSDTVFEEMLERHRDRVECLIDLGLLSPKFLNLAHIFAVRMLLKFSYFDGQPVMNLDGLCVIQKELIDDIKVKDDDKFIKALDIVHSKKLVRIRDKKVKVVRLAYDAHDALGIIICDALSRPIQFVYCDSYIPLRTTTETGYSFGAVTFDLDHKKFKDLQDLILIVQRAFHNKTPYLVDDLDDVAALNLQLKPVRQQLAKFVVCDHRRVPDIKHCSIPTQKQENDRFNCSYKSTNIAIIPFPTLKYPIILHLFGLKFEIKTLCMSLYTRFLFQILSSKIFRIIGYLRVGNGIRYLAQMMSPDLDYDLSELEVPTGDLYEHYKNFRRKITDKAMDIFIDFASRDPIEFVGDDQKINVEYVMALQKKFFAEIVKMLEKAQRKRDEARVIKLQVVVERLSVHFSQDLPGQDYSADDGLQDLASSDAAKPKRDLRDDEGADAKRRRTGASAGLPSFSPFRTNPHEAVAAAGTGAQFEVY